MRKRIVLFSLGVLLAAAMMAAPSRGGARAEAGPYKVLAPITHGNLTVFPVVAAEAHDTGKFLTLDEGVRAGDVVVTEAGRVAPLIRRRPGIVPTPYRGDRAEVNRLVLINNSERPLLLLAGEIVTGGKQDRVIGKDRIIPAHSDPMDLDVFCVEPGRWTAVSDKFGSLGVQMAQPSVRAKAMGDKDQQEVWSAVRRSTDAALAVAAPPGAPRPATTSYAQTMGGAEVQRHVAQLAEPIERDYRGIIRELRDRGAVGVVAAVNGRIIWADVFASPALLEKYWPKLVRSYAAEALVRTSGGGDAGPQQAQEFLDRLDGRRQVVESEPGIFSHAEISGDGYRVFELTSLLPKTGFAVHIAKMAE